MTFTLHRLDPAADLDVVHAWVTEPRAEFWGMTDHSRDEVREIYAYLDASPIHHAYLVREQGRPVAIFQTYDPFHDPVGEAYGPRPGDLGVHLFVAPTDDPRPGFTGRLLDFLLARAFADPAVLRLVGEPDHRNAGSVARARRTGATGAGRVELGHKQAELFFLERPTPP